MISTIYFLLALLNNLYGSNEIIPSIKEIPAIRKACDFVFSVFVFSSCCAISIYFWKIFSIDPNLMHPPNVNALHIPTWYNHAIHTLITVCAIFELFWTHHNFPSNERMIFWLGVYMFIYLAWLNLLNILTGAWAYPFLSVFSTLQRIGFYIGTIMFSWTLNLGSKYLNSLVWSSRVNSVNKKHWRHIITHPYILRSWIKIYIYVS